jgi:hypothetical protein
LFTSRALSFCEYSGKVQRVDEQSESPLRLNDERSSKEPPMFTVVEPEFEISLEFGESTPSPKKKVRHAKTADIRAFLTDLKNRPASQREFLRKLLKSAAAHSSCKVSVVRPANTPQSPKP